MEEKGEVDSVIIDTYTLLAMAYGQLGGNAEKVLLGVRGRRILGLIPVTVVYEYCVHWYRGRIPVLKSLDEVKTFLSSYFKIVDLSMDDYMNASRIKVEGDRILRGLRVMGDRSISLVDATIIAVAFRYKAPIVTGDLDLSCVAKAMGFKVIW
ncbi:MAG: PIN domain-containing protein [Candidatus Methanomethylicia archaeon]